MENDIKIKHIVYGISIFILFNLFLYLSSDFLHFSNIYKFLFFDTFGIIALLLGLFKFHKGLSLGLTGAGICATIWGWYYFHFKFTETVQFISSIIALAIVCFALYKLYKKQNK